MATEIANTLELHVVDLINVEREQAGLNPVHVEVHLNSAAQDHSDWMADQQAISHTGKNGSAPTNRIEDADFPLAGGSWNLTENVAYTGLNGQANETDVDWLHSALMESTSHQENILDPDVAYVGVGLSVGSVEGQNGTQDALFLTQNFANTTQPVSVQEVVEGQTVTTSYVDGEPVPGTSELVPDSEEIPDHDDGGPDEEDDNEQAQQASSGGSCFVATAAYGNSLHPDVVTLRRFRDDVLVRYPSGRAFIRFYWKVGPVVAKIVKTTGISGRIARLALKPLVFFSRKILYVLIAVPRQDVGLKTAWRAMSH
ncbi:CAP domain-containing protein [Paracoccus gahaiensis]|nr:CFI-box-CTERM domain-containing protein [Paracoccus gahaiensis]